MRIVGAIIFVLVRNCPLLNFFMASDNWRFCCTACYSGFFRKRKNPFHRFLNILDRQSVHDRSVAVIITEFAGDPTIGLATDPALRHLQYDAVTRFTVTVNLQGVLN